MSSQSELRRDARKGSESPSRQRANDDRQPPPHKIASPSSIDTPPGSALQQPQKMESAQHTQQSTQQTEQTRQLLEPEVSYDPQTLEETLKNSEVFKDVRQCLHDELDRLGLIHPQDQHIHYDTKNAGMYDIIIFPHMGFCRDQRLIDDIDHSWVPVPGGYLLMKYRRAVVYQKCDAVDGDLKVGLFFTFSETSMDMMRKQGVFDEVLNKNVPSLSYYVHIVEEGHSNNSQSFPECLSGGVPVRYRAAPGCQAGSTEDSFIDVYAPYMMSSGTPFSIVGRLADSDSVLRMINALKATFARTLSGLNSAVEKMRKAEQLQKERDGAT